MKAKFTRFFIAIYTACLFSGLALADEGENINILAMGDSLTYGFLGDINTEPHPYSEKLQELLQGQAGHKTWTVSTQGFPGEQTKQMLSRLAYELKTSKIKYKYVVILGGTNDLARPGTPSAKEIFANLKQMYELVYKHGALPVVVTIPEASFPDSLAVKADLISDYLKRRDAVNESIRTLVKSSRKPIVLVDLERSIRQPSEEHPELASLWDDHLHFSASGYDAFGELVFKAIVQAPQYDCDKLAKQAWCVIL